ncbi:hypothetical protein LEMLEM_LOCUS805 [Lemmus lemmus]
MILPCFVTSYLDLLHTLKLGDQWEEVMALLKFFLFSSR